MTNDAEAKALALANGGKSRAEVRRSIQYQSSAPSFSEESEESGAGLPISHYLWVLRRHKWRLLAFVVFAVTATVIVSSRLTPYYESSATVDIDRMAPTGIIGQEANGG